MPGIEIENISFQHQKNKSILQDVSCIVPENKISVLIGSNGAGKSTFIKLCAGILEPTTGIVKIDDHHLRDYAKKHKAKRIAYLSQNQCIPEGVSVYDFVKLGRFCHRKLFKKNIADKTIIQEALASVDMLAYKNKFVSQLSGGQQQRVRIALLLAQQAKYLLLDEPMTGLDLKQQLEIIALLQQLRDKHDKTIIVVLHDLNHVNMLADCIYALKDGQISYACLAGKTLPTDVINDIYGLSM